MGHMIEHRVAGTWVAVAVETSLVEEVVLGSR